MRDPLKSLNTKPFNLARAEMQKKAASMLKEASAPKDGIWYWAFIKPEWKLITWAFPAKDKKNVNHIELWPKVCQSILAPHYKWTQSQLREAMALPYSMPRGRVTAEMLEEKGQSLTYFFIRHGNDTPPPHNINEVISTYDLSLHVLEGLAELIYDPEETMVAEEQKAMATLIGGF
jgi:hypothetical protein